MTSRIVGGSDTEPHAFPWQLYIQIVDHGGECGGVLLNKRFGISAMHCFKNVPDLENPGEVCVLVRFFKVLPSHI